MYEYNIIMVKENYIRSDAKMMAILDYWDGVLYYPILIIILTVAGLYFTGKTGFVQLLSLIHI